MVGWTAVRAFSLGYAPLYDSSPASVPSRLCHAICSPFFHLTRWRAICVVSGICLRQNRRRQATLNQRRDCLPLLPGMRDMPTLVFLLLNNAARRAGVVWGWLAAIPPFSCLSLSLYLPFLPLPDYRQFFWVVMGQSGMMVACLCGMVGSTTDFPFLNLLQTLPPTNSPTTSAHFFSFSQRACTPTPFALPYLPSNALCLLYSLLCTPTYCQDGMAFFSPKQHFPSLFLLPSIQQ